MVSWVISFITALLTWINQGSRIPVPVTPLPSPVKNVKNIQVGGINYGYAVVGGIDPGQLKLVPNFSDKSPSNQLVKDNQCELGINGGFYTPENLPLGWLVIAGSEISSAKSTSLLLNGYVAVADGKVEILESKPKSLVSYGLQTGPVLVSGGKARQLSMAKDELARRMVMGTDKAGKAVFLTVFNPQTEILGPRLADLPQIVVMVAKKEIIDLEAAVNLDGGRASAFYSPDLTLKEADPVGGWWCVGEDF